MAKKATVQNPIPVAKMIAKFLIPFSIADPFPVRHETKEYVFAEKFSAVDNFGKICCYELDSRGMPYREIGTLESPHHRSYPCILEFDGEKYMTCEAVENNELVVFQCTDFPYRWEPCSVVASDRSYSDPTLFWFNGFWWVMATAYDKYSSGNSTLYAWHSKNGIRGPWTAHAKNPIKCDISNTRSAGTPFLSEGRFYRPAQDCSKTYGRAIVMNEILQLDPNNFREREIRKIQAHSDLPKGIHHISGQDGCTFIDGRRSIFMPSLALRKILYRFRKKKSVTSRYINSIDLVNNDLTANENDKSENTRGHLVFKKVLPQKCVLEFNL